MPEYSGADINAIVDIATRRQIAGIHGEQAVFNPSLQKIC